MTAADRFLEGARYARDNASGYRSLAQTQCSEKQRTQWLNKAQEAEERAEWYEQAAGSFNMLSMLR